MTLRQAADDHGHPATKIREDFQGAAPYIIIKFINTTMYNIHTAMYNNVKFLLEHVDDNKF